ncbi:MAG: nucleotidyl transferase AbiEii/AbiGii toxin family protein [Tepidiformaceae bacterium]
MAAQAVNYLESSLRRVKRDLNAIGVPWALVGGLAVSARAGSRSTKDIDAAVAIDSEPEADALVNQLLGLGYRTAMILEDPETRKLSTVRLFAPLVDERELLFDLLMRTCGIEHEVISSATDVMVVPALTVPTATLAHLLAMKTLSTSDLRPNDLPDIQSLVDVATDADIVTARDALRLMTERGFNREKDLQHDFDGYLARFRS